MQETLVRFLGWEVPMEKGLVTHSSILGLPWWLSGIESAHQCRRLGFCPWVEKIPWRKKWQPTPFGNLGNLKDRGAWRAIVHAVIKESDTT